MMHKKYKSETVTVFEGAWKAAAYDDFPKIEVPQSVAGYTNYAKWDAAPSCSGGSGAAAAGNSTAGNNTTGGGGAAAGNNTTAANNTTGGGGAANNTTGGGGAANNTTDTDGGDDKADEEPVCTWEDYGTPRWRERTRWVKKENCKVVTRPPKPWPASIRCWRKVREWRAQNQDKYN